MLRFAGLASMKHIERHFVENIEKKSVRNHASRPAPIRYSRVRLDRFKKKRSGSSGAPVECMGRQTIDCKANTT